MLRDTAHGRQVARPRARTGALVVGSVGFVLFLAGFPSRSLPAGARAPGRSEESGVTRTSQPPTRKERTAPAYAVGVRTVTLIDPSRTIKFKGGSREPRPVLSYIYYPAEGVPGGAEQPNAPADATAGPFPLVVFAHGFGVTPAIYAGLLDAWVRAGFVVAAPLFPLANAHTPGGPEASDVVNQPGDMKLVISSMLAMSASSTGPLAGTVNPGEIAVAGHSDGGETALAVAFSRRLRDPRVRAALIFSGAEMSNIGGYRFPASGLPLLAVQGTADTDNEPRYTYEYFVRAGRPKFLLRLLGAGHLAPYTDEQPQLGIVEHTSLAFLDRYLKGESAATGRLLSSGSVHARAALTSDP